MILAFTIPGEPQAKERAKVFGFKSKTGKTGARGVTPPRTRAYAERGKLCAQAAVSRAGWAFTEGEYYSVTVSVFRTHFGKGGDSDNYAKAALDVMNGIVFADDRYVRMLRVSIEMDATNPRLDVVVEKLTIERPKAKRKGVAAA